MKSRKERIIDALMILKKDAPEFFVEEIMGCCPSDLGLPAENRRMCGMDDVSSEFTSEYCDRCWKIAMEADK